MQAVQSPTSQSGYSPFSDNGTLSIPSIRGDVYTPGVVEVYKSETHEVIRRFFLRQLSFPNCIAALDSALAGLLPRLQPEQLGEVRGVMLANNDLVMKEMANRSQQNAQRRTCMG